MTVIRDLRQRVEALEEHECAPTDRAAWALPVAAAIAIVGCAFAIAWAQYAPAQPTAEIECIRARGQWVSGWRVLCEFTPEQRKAAQQ